MLLKEWADAEANVCIPDKDVSNVDDEAELFLVGQFNLAYLKGKGLKYVSVLVPINLVESIRILN